MTLLYKVLENSVLEKIRPTREEYEKRDRVFNKVKEAVEEELKREGLEAEVTLQGSAAKDTWLRGSLELDVFVLFPPDKTKEWLKVVALRVLERAAKKLGEYQIRYAEHPYVNLKVEDVEVDLVPALKVKSGSEAKTAVDRTPFHTEWVKRKLDEMGEGARDEVRLLKAFFKGIGVYGAEIKVEGFSGYVTELLIIYYGGFAETLGAMSEWKPPVFVDPAGYGDRAKFLRKFNAPMVLPDPVDPRRNATAAVSLKSMAIASLAAWRYYSRPSPRFYFKPPAPEVKAKRPTFLIEIPINGEHPPETIWGELKKITRSLIKSLRRIGFEVTRYQCWSDEESKAFIVVETFNEALPPEVLRTGPPVWEKKHLVSFITAHDAPVTGPWVEDDRIYLIESRDVRTFEEIALNLLSRYSATSLDISKSSVRRVTSPKEEWLKWFVAGRYWWW